MSRWGWGLLGVAIFLQAGLAHADSDAADRENFDFGIVASEKKDCVAAADAFDKVTGALRHDAAFAQYAAPANECAGRLEKALELYRELEAEGGDALLLRHKIAELRYAIAEKKKQPAGAGSPGPAATPAPAVNGRTDVTFRSPDADHHYEVVAVTDAGGRQNCSVTFLKPCTISIPAGPAKVSVSGSGSFTRSLTIPPVAATFTIHHDYHHGLLYSGLVVTAVGACGVAYGIANSDDSSGNNAGAVGFVAGASGGFAAVVGISLILIDQVRNRGDGIRSDDTAQGPATGPTFAGAAVIPLHNGAAAGLTFTF